MKKVNCAGGIIVDKDRILLIRHKRGGLAFAKGHIEAGETVEAAALREVTEETGYAPKIIQYLGCFERLSIEHSGEQVLKKIDLYKMDIHSVHGGKTDEKPEWSKTETAESNMQFPEEAAFVKLHKDELN
jgi:8-oxo-dGTP pyrophosphatase MutT (NUDIX family)